GYRSDRAHSSLLPAGLGLDQLGSEPRSRDHLLLLLSPSDTARYQSSRGGERVRGTQEYPVHHYGGIGCYEWSRIPVWCRPHHRIRFGKSRRQVMRKVSLKSGDMKKIVIPDGTGKKSYVPQKPLKVTPPPTKVDSTPKK